jgi:hypothetical protein
VQDSRDAPPATLLELNCQLACSVTARIEDKPIQGAVVAFSRSFSLR